MPLQMAAKFCLQGKDILIDLCGFLNCTWKPIEIRGTFIDNLCLLKKINDIFHQKQQVMSALNNCFHNEFLHIYLF